MSEITELKGLVTKLLPVKLLENNNGQIEGVPKNPRFIKDWRYKLLLQSLTESPEMLSLKELWVYKVGNIYVVIAGNMRLRGSKEKGYKSLPCKILPPETTIEKLKEYAIKDNSGYGDWEMDSLANEWESPKIVEWGVELHGWENGEVPFEESETAEAKEDDFDTTPPAVAKTVLGDLYEIGEHRLLCGDSTDSDAVARLMNGEKADMVFTSPPYNANTKFTNVKNEGKLYENYDDNLESKEYIEFCQSVLNNCFFNTNGFIFWNINYNTNSRSEYLEQIYPYLEKLSETIIWKKQALPVPHGLTRTYEFIFVFSTLEKKIRLGHANKTEFNFWEVNNAGALDKSHRAAFPIELPSKAINLVEKTKIVLEPFAGSGSTMVASHQLNRKCYGMELEPKYVDVTIKRMLNLDSTLRVKRNGVDVTEEWRA